MSAKYLHFENRTLICLRLSLKSTTCSVTSLSVELYVLHLLSLSLSLSLLCGCVMFTHNAIPHKVNLARYEEEVVELKEYMEAMCAKGMDLGFALWDAHKCRYLYRKSPQIFCCLMVLLCAL